MLAFYTGCDTSTIGINFTVLYTCGSRSMYPAQGDESAGRTEECHKPPQLRPRSPIVNDFCLNEKEVCCS